MMRVWLKGTNKTYVLVEPPYPTVGETLNMPDGSKFVVRKVRHEEGFEVKFPAASSEACLQTPGREGGSK